MDWQDLSVVHYAILRVETEPSLFPKGESKMLTYDKIAEILGDWRWLRFQIFEDKIEVEGFQNIEEATTHQDDCDILVFNNQMELTHFVPKEMQEVTAMLKEIGQAVGQKIPAQLQWNLIVFQTRNPKEKIKLMRPKWNVEKLK